MGLDAVELEDVRDPRPGERVGDRIPDVREDVVGVSARIELVLQVQGGAAMPPAGDPRQRSETSTMPAPPSVTWLQS